ncbi:HNH endonuclease signature motif containing protein [Mycobacterium talmoniae]|uniref:HNH nuclease domain-containing protein n=1 Tax=Mycobacterium talmoniae TaxID=1858794 RepID=A0A1S1NC30_9MYCO|nr:MULTISPECIES: HNH endonuclease signature motif containing protein [Mycobacterium]OHV01771.1 hypothetical protein BKN37_16505 [Mycobacterium talmoniae]PQM47678.1 hypothetical protein C1Y40_02114 [Mycobacterium talmoniae]TDH56539.1 HNH endonuclease [Mycobacterium eburneum]
MFDVGIPDLDELADADDTMLAVSITGWDRIEAAASARRLAAIAELVHRRTDNAGHSAWACDDWDAAAAEVAAALNLSHGKASGQMYLATALRDRLPRVAEAFAEGMLSTKLVSTIAWHTQLIKDDEALALVDKSLARDAVRYGPLSANKTAQAIDAIIDQYDPGALRHARAYARSRDVVVDNNNTRDGVTPIWGNLYAHDATVLDRRLMQMAHEVCDDDPRTIAQRRADALGVLAAGGDRLVCGCGNAECPMAAGDSSPTSNVLVHVLAEEAALETPVDPYNSGEGPPSRPITPDMTLAEALAPDPEPDPPAVKSPPALILGETMMPAPLLAEMIRNGATVRPLRIPDPDSPPESGYRPSTALADFIRCRDLTCRFPGCDRPAEFCDLDHTIPYDLGGLTHPSNLKALCRKHHLLKTFWAGWRDRQYPDGSVVWTSPSGQTYTTYPGSRLLFPRLCTPTGELPTPPPTQPDTGYCRGLAMPLRKRTRAQDRSRRIRAERALNAAHIAERNEPPPF